MKLQKILDRKQWDKCKHIITRYCDEEIWKYVMVSQPIHQDDEEVTIFIKIDHLKQFECFMCNDKILGFENGEDTLSIKFVYSISVRYVGTKISIEVPLDDIVLLFDDWTVYHDQN